MTKKNDTEEIEEKLGEEEKSSEGDTVQEHIKDLENKYKRALADYQNLEKRVREERREWIISANKDLILRLLPILDTLILASNHSKDQALLVTTQQFLDILKSENVEKIKTDGEEFDPTIMEVISTQEVDPSEEGKVLQEVRVGYRIGDKILRVAQVIVGRGS